MGSEAALLREWDDELPPAGGDVDWTAMGQLSQQLARAHDREALLAAALRVLRGPVQAAAAAIWEYRDDGRLELAADDRAEDDVRPDWTDLFKAPLTSGGKLIGVLEAYAVAADGFGEAQRGAMQVAAALLADGLHRARLAAAGDPAKRDHEASARLAELEAVWRLWQASSAAASLSELFDALMLELPAMVPYDAAAFLDCTEPLCVVHRRAMPTNQLPDLLDRLGRAAEAYGVVPSLRPEQIRLVGFDSESDGVTDAASGVAVPLLGGGEPIGIVYLLAADPNVLTEHCVRVLHTYAAHAGEALDRVRELRAIEIERLQVMVDSLPTGVVLLDSANRLLLANPVGSRALALLGGGADRADRLGPYTLADLRAEAEAYGTDLLEHEIEVRADDRTHNFRVSLVPVADNGEALGTAISIEDVSSRRQSEARMFQDARLAAVGEFAAGLAHELNNPLMIILGLAESLADSGRMPADCHDRLADIQDAAVRAAQIVAQVTQFADTQASGAWDTLLLSDVVDPALGLFATQCERDKISVEVAWPESLPSVQGNAGQIQQIVLFLLHNAREAIIQSPDHGQVPRGHIWVSAAAEGGSVRLDIEDDGPGVEPAIRERIFEVFFTTKHEWKGKGLGLSIATRLARDHDGDVMVDASQHGGARFSLLLPARGG